MRSISSSQIKFGELGIGIAVKLFKARDEPETISFHQGCSCGSRLKHKNWCDTCDKEVAYGDITKLFDDNGKMIAIDKSKLPKLESGDITIQGFSDSKEFFDNFKNPMLAFRDYYLIGWDKKKPVSQKPLSALFSALQGKVGYGTMVMRSKENKIALLTSGKSLMIVVLANPDEIRDNEFEIEATDNKDLKAFVDNLNKPLSSEFWIDKTSAYIKSIIKGLPTEVEPKQEDFLTAIAKPKKK